MPTPQPLTREGCFDHDAIAVINQNFTNLVAGQDQSISTKSANYSIQPSDFTVRADTTNGNVTISLPPMPTHGAIYNLKKIASANTLTISGNGNNIDGSSALTITTLNQNTTVQFSSEANAGWSVL